MRIRSASSNRGEAETADRSWLQWLQQITTVVYLIAGVFLLYQYWSRLHRQSVLVLGILFVGYAIYRFFLVRRSMSRLGSGR